MKEEVVQKFCRDCYTTTPHKVIEVADPKEGSGYKKTVCLKCSETPAFKKATPKRKVTQEDFLEI